MLDWTEVNRLARDGNLPPPRRVEKADAQWRAELAPDVYRITRQAATERPFSSEMCSRFEPGRYGCACCGTLLFDSAEKFESGTGWPSFSQPLDPAAVAYRAAHSHGMTRIEAVCNVCDAHLGHVFPDGPPPSGLRYCMNALSLSKAEPGA